MAEAKLRPRGRSFAAARRRQRLRRFAIGPNFRRDFKPKLQRRPGQSVRRADSEENAKPTSAPPARHARGRLLRSPDVVRDRHRIAPDCNLIVSPSFEWWSPALDGVSGSPAISAAYTDGAGFTSACSRPAVQREVQREVTREKEVLRTESRPRSTSSPQLRDEIRNPIAAAKAWCSRWAEDPTSNENVEYAKVALDELARVERSVSHLLKYAKEPTTVSKTWGWPRCSITR